MIPEIDESTWPIVRIRYGETIELDEIPALEASLADIMKRRGPLVTVADISALSVTATTASHRKKLAEAADRLAAAGVFIAEAIVVRNSMARVLYVGYSWMRAGKRYPSQTFPDHQQALSWAREQLRTRGS